MIPYDVVTLGEALFRLTPPHYQTLEQTSLLEMHFGGSECNTAIGLARLGLRAAWWSRLTDNPLGRIIESHLRGFGVDTRFITWTPNDRIGFYFMQEGLPPRPSQVIYDRAYSSASRMTPDDLPSDLFQPQQSRWLHLTGITAAISQSAAETLYHSVQLARTAGWQISFDSNYRSKLCSPAEAEQLFDPLMSQADLIFIPQRDLDQIYRLSGEQALEQFAARYPQAVIAMTCGKQGAFARSRSGSVYYQPIFEAASIGRIGGGDAFTAGFLYGYLQNAEALPAALLWGSAAAALKYSIPGDQPLFQFSDVEALVNQGQPTSAVIR
ncbi:MAG: sugar kinase [Anaerolineae bacterium]|nr:sugar kinase [Anaerolineae bacterium]